MLKLVFMILSALALGISAEYTKLQWAVCGTPGTNILRITNLDAKPMPAVHPGDIDITFEASNSSPVTGNLKTDMNIIRTVAGLALPVRCTIVQGISVGSCSYVDLCKNVLQDIAQINSQNCPLDFVALGIDCNCPFNIPAQSVNQNINLSLDDLSTSAVSFLASGDFDVTLKVNNIAGQPITCLSLKFTVKKKTAF